MDIKSKLLVGREKLNCTCQFKEGEERSGQWIGALCGYRRVPGHLWAAAMPGPVCPHCSDTQCFPALLMAELAMPSASCHITTMGAAKESHGEEVAPLQTCPGVHRWAKPPPGS